MGFAYLHTVSTYWDLAGSKDPSWKQFESRLDELGMFLYFACQLSLIVERFCATTYCRYDRDYGWNLRAGADTKEEKICCSTTAIGTSANNPYGSVSHNVWGGLLKQDGLSRPRKVPSADFIFWGKLGQQRPVDSKKDKNSSTTSFGSGRSSSISFLKLSGILCWPLTGLSHAISLSSLWAILSPVPCSDHDHKGIPPRGLITCRSWVQKGELVNNHLVFFPLINVDNHRNIRQ